MDKKEISYQNYYRKLFNPSLYDKLKERIHIIKLSEQEVKDMKKLLIVDAKPIFLASKKDKFLERYFDERIETLDNGSIYKLYNSFIQFKNFIGTVYEDIPRDFFITYMLFTFSTDRWLVKKHIDWLRS